VVVRPEDLQRCYVPRRQFTRSVAKLEVAEHIRVTGRGRQEVGYTLFDRVLRIGRRKRDDAPAA
jgi:hypothetical protein